MSHTPGPWGDLTIFANSLTIGIDWPEGDERDHYLCEVTSGDPDELEANARLIAAAPDLLEHLKGMCKAMEKALTYLPADTLAVYCGEWLASSNDVISKATDTYKIPASAKGEE